MAESCGGCKFWRPITAGGVNACHFLLDTGIPRCYPPEECIYHTKGLKNMPKALSPETIGQIEQMNAEGKSISQICDALSVSSATVTRVRNGKLKSPEAPTAMENASEDIKSIGNSDTNIITDVPEVVKQEEIPGVVVDALLEKIQNISEKIETEEKYLAALKADKKSLERWYHENCTAFGRDYKRRNDHAAR